MNICNLVNVDSPPNKKSQFKILMHGASPPPPKKKVCEEWGWGKEKVVPVLDHRGEYTRQQQLLALELWLLREKLE